MTRSDDRAGAPDLALGLVGALAPVLSDVASPDALRGAREAAQVLGLDGLDRLLAACSRHVGRAWPAELEPVLERLRRLAARAAETGVLGPFREADRELAGLADELSALQWSPSWRAGAEDALPVATLSLEDALGELPLADDSSREVARRSRLLPPVAAALRAALDWLTGDSGRPLALRTEDSVLEVSCEHIDFDALGPATAVLAAVGANLGPGAGPVGTWMVRVPLHTGREVYMMLVHGGVPIAIPWHAVLRLHMTATAEVAARESLGGWPLLQGPLVAGARPAGEAPLVLVAHGRKRGWLLADRLVWRLHAEPVALAERTPDAGLTAMVETEEGERFWLADPSWLLASVDAPSLTKPVRERAPEPGPEPESEPESELEPEPESVLRPDPEPPSGRDAESPATHEEPIARIEPSPEPPSLPPPPRPAERSAPRLRLLTAADVERIEAAAPAAPVPPPAAAAPARPSGPEPAAPARVEQAPVAAVPGRWPARNALVAEDSITARIFLARLLSRLGFDVRTVDTAAALRAELERGAWSLACVDIELPDETGTGFLAGLVARHGARTPFLALVRDAEDRAAARHAGIERMLRKPFDHQELEQVLGHLGLVPRRP